MYVCGSSSQQSSRATAEPADPAAEARLGFQSPRAALPPGSRPTRSPRCGAWPRTRGRDCPGLQQAACWSRPPPVLKRPVIECQKNQGPPDLPGPSGPRGLLLRRAGLTSSPLSCLPSSLPSSPCSDRHGGRRHSCAPPPPRPEPRPWGPGWSLPPRRPRRAAAGLDPLGQLSSDRRMEWPICRFARSTSTYSGRSSGRQTDVELGQDVIDAAAPDLHARARSPRW